MKLTGTTGLLFFGGPDMFPIHRTSKSVPDMFQIHSTSKSVPDMFPIHRTSKSVPDMFPFHRTSKGVPDMYRIYLTSKLNRREVMGTNINRRLILEYPSTTVSSSIWKTREHVCVSSQNVMDCISPWYNRSGRLDVENQFPTYLPTYLPIDGMKSDLAPTVKCRPHHEGGQSKNKTWLHSAEELFLPLVLVSEPVAAATVSWRSCVLWLSIKTHTRLNMNV